jgi:hypothetical protein
MRQRTRAAFAISGNFRYFCTRAHEIPCIAATKIHPMLNIG